MLAAHYAVVSDDCVRDPMIAPASERAPRMLLLICEDEQGLPMEVIRPEPSLRRLQAALRAWLAGVLPDRLCYALGLLRPIAADPLAAAGSGFVGGPMGVGGLESGTPSGGPRRRAPSPCLHGLLPWSAGAAVAGSLGAQARPIRGAVLILRQSSVAR